MKKIIALVFILYIVTGVLKATAQDKIPSDYDRSSFTIILAVHENERLSQQQIEDFKKIKLSTKFYDNAVDFQIMRIPGNVTNLQSFIEEKLKSEKIAHKIIAKWYNRQNDGSLNQELIHERGMYNAIDEDVIKASNSKRGNAALEDYGNRLINMSYITVIDYYNIKSAKELNKKDYHGWKGFHTSYVYKIDFNEDAQYTLYDNVWIYPEDSEEVKAKKRDTFFDQNFPIAFFAKEVGSLDATQANAGTSASILAGKQKSDDELFEEMIQMGYDNTVFLLSKKYEQFRVKTTLNSARPLKAKIGKKEDLKVDQRFFVFEYVYNEKKNSTDQKRKGVVRVKKVANNMGVATGSSQSSTFYQVAGVSLEEGMLMQQRLDYGVLIYAGFEAGGMGGVYGQVGYRLGNKIAIPAFYSYVEGGAGGGYFKYGAGLGKGFYFMKNFELQFSGSVGFEQDANFKTLYFKPTATLAMNLLHNFQIYGNIGAYTSFGVYDSDNNPVPYYTWEQYTGGERTPGAFVGFGVRILY